MAGFIFLISLILILITTLPSPRLKNNVILESEFLLPRELSLEFPKYLWFGHTEKINLRLQKDTQSQQKAFINTGDKDDESENLGQGLENPEFIQNIEVDLVLSGVEINPRGVSITPLIKEQELSLHWNIIPVAKEDVTGSMWIHINTISNENNPTIHRELLFIKEISIKNNNFFGLNTKNIFWISIIGIATSFLLIFSMVEKNAFVKIAFVKIKANKNFLL